jgi:hypothetical protein
MIAVVANQEDEQKLIDEDGDQSTFAQFLSPAVRVGPSSSFLRHRLLSEVPEDDIE